MAKDINEVLLEKLSQMEETLWKIESEISETKRKTTIRFYVTWWIFWLVAIYILWFYVMVKSFIKEVSSEDFVSMVQQKVVEVTPTIATNLWKALQDSAPKIYDQLEWRVQDFIPQVATTITDDVLPKFLDQMKEKSDHYLVEITEWAQVAVDEFLKKNLPEINQWINDTMKTLGDNATIDDRQLEEIKNLVVQKLDESVNYYVKDKLWASIEQCVIQTEQIFNSIDEFKWMPEDERSAYAFSMFRGFVDWLEYLKTWKLPNWINDWSINTKSFTSGSQEEKLYLEYLLRSENGTAKMPKLTTQNWWKAYPIDVRAKVYARLQAEWLTY